MIYCYHSYGKVALINGSWIITMPTNLRCAGIICREERCDVIADPLTRIFRVSLANGQTAEAWKRANVTPIFKKGQKHMCAVPIIDPLA